MNEVETNEIGTVNIQEKEKILSDDIIAEDLDGEVDLDDLPL